MDVKEFGRGIGLTEEIVETLDVILEEPEYQQYRRQYEKEHAACFERIRGRRNYPRLFLGFFCRMACEVSEEYKRRGIEEKVFWDTFTDIRLWCENAKIEHGDYGIYEYQWFWRHVDMTIFRLGRLQYELMNAEHDIEEDGVCIRGGMPVVNIHIPQGEPLSWAACEESLKEAYRWFGHAKPYVCHSWLLFPGLSGLLPGTSHIIEFQERFKLLETDYAGREAERRIFGILQEDPGMYPERTSLQRAAKRYLESGQRLGNGFGILPECHTIYCQKYN